MLLDQERTGRFMAELRKAKNMTQEQLAEKLGVSNRSVSRWENGKTMPDLSMLPAVSEELGVSILELLEGKRIEAGEEFRKSADLLMELSYEEKRKKAKLVNRYFFGGFCCIGIVCLHSLYGILDFAESADHLSAALSVFGVFLEVLGFYYNSKDKRYSSREIEILSGQGDQAEMKTAEEMLQFSRKHQKTELKQYEKAFQVIAEQLGEEESVCFSMVADEFTINEMSGGLWHLGIAVTKDRILMAGEKITGRVMVRYGTEEILRKEIRSIRFDGKRIVILTEKNEIRIQGENLNAVIEKFQESCQTDLAEI